MLRRSAGRVTPAVHDAIRGSIARVRDRARSRPLPAGWPDLPITLRLDEIARAIESRRVVVVSGETGSGKSTQLPRLCLALGRGAAGMIAHTQPRRLAARSIAARIAEELAVPLGGPVGFKVRFTDRTGPDTFIKVMTDGVLLAEMQRDRRLEHYDTIIIDEAHERSLNIDFLLGYLKQLLPRRPDLKLIITSATIDARRFAEHFADDLGPAPVIEVSGRSFPIETRYRPPQPAPDGSIPDVPDRIADAVRELQDAGPGDILVFLPGEREIREAARELRKRFRDLDILPLYSRLSFAEQQRVFAPHDARRVVLATNVAETSLTVPGVRFVIDTGDARTSRYSPRTRTQQLPIEPVSRASADQRKGRCGRLGPGVCIRLYDEADYLARPEFAEPEILRTNLASVILQMKALRLGDIDDFPFLQRPEPRLIRDGYETLRELHAIDEHGELTAIGRRLARLPIDPRFGRILLASLDERCLAESLVIVAFLSVQDPRERPHDDRQRADAAHARFADESSDFLAILNLWRFLRERNLELGSTAFKRLCRDHFINHMRFREWQDVHRQLRQLMGEMGALENDVPAEPAAIHRAILPGLLSAVGRLDRNHEYQGVRGTRFSIYPGSALFRKTPQWVVAAELIRTTKLWAHTVAAVQPRWIEQAAGHLVRREYFDPHWDESRQRVAAFERVTLWGLDLVKKRRVPYGKVDPRLARELFIHHALVDGRLRSDAPFLRHNRQMQDQVEALEARTRRRDIAADPEARFAFFDARVGDHVYDRKSFESWRRGAERHKPHLLFMRRRDLIRHDADPVRPDEYPDSIRFGDLELPLTYTLQPGSDRDGVTIETPIEALHLIDPDRCEWIVPGLIREKVIAIVRALPRNHRRVFGSAPAFADDFLARHNFGAGSLADAIASHIKRVSGVYVPPDACRSAAIPPHLLINVRVHGRGGEVLAESRDLAQLTRSLAHQARHALASADHPLTRRRVVEWDFGDLPDEIELHRHGVTIRAYPALAESDGIAAIRLFPSRDEAERSMRLGLRRLFAIAARDDLRDQPRRIPRLAELAALYAPIGPADELRHGVLAIAIDDAFDTDAPIRSQDAFTSHLRAGIDRLDEATLEACDLVERILRARITLAARLDAGGPATWKPALDDLRSQLDLLTPPGFLADTPRHWLKHFPRYLAAATKRLDRLAADPARDAERARDLAPFWNWLAPRWKQQLARSTPDPRLEQLRWHLEELRVSIFAQELGASLPVSAERIRSRFADLWKQP